MLIKTSPTQKIGEVSEARAAQYLQKAGCKIIEKNFSAKVGEIDLIIRDGEFLVFLEVRYRQCENYGSGAETVTLTKQRKIIRTAQAYLQRKKVDVSVPCRFDIISITKDAMGEWVINWIKDAFQM